jgi:hypothetical protein
MAGPPVMGLHQPQEVLAIHESYPISYPTVARQRHVLFPREEGEISRYLNLCQICASRLLIWVLWQIW